MSEIKIMNSLKDIINIKYDEYKNKVAFIQKDENTKEFFKISYAKLKEDINGLGTYMLKKLNLKGKNIAIIGENSYKWYETFMAVSCGVGVIVPIDKELTENEILKLIKHSEIKCIVYSTKIKEKIENIKKNLDEDVCYIEMSKEKSDKDVFSYDEIVKKGKVLVEKGEQVFIESEIDREKMCSLFFTSRNISDTKGVMLSHRNLVTSVYACYTIAPKFCNYTSLSILPSHYTYEFIFNYLYMTSIGATIAISELSEDIYKDMQYIKPDFILVVPEIMKKINEKIENDIKENKREILLKTVGKFADGLSRVGIDFKRKLFKSIHNSFGGNLKYIFCITSEIKPELVEKMESYGFRILQGYALTETSSFITSTKFDDGDSSTVGKALYGVDVRIDLTKNVNENSNVGEIIVKGDSVMLGYYKNEKATKKSIINGWFYTGDTGYFDLRGNLVVLNKDNNQKKK